MKNKKTIIWLLILHVSLFVYALSSFFSKLASKQQFLSWQFFVFYACVLLAIGVYAIIWQQVIKHLPLITAYANKAITILWGILFGVVAFNESYNVKQIIATVVIIVGVLLVVLSDGITHKEKKDE